MTAPLVERVRRRLVDDGLTRVPDSSRVAAALRDEGVVLGDESLLELVGSLRDELGGLGPLQSLLLDPCVTDVLVNGPDEVWIDRGR
ncbi:MAG: pilus assembly protein CpaF, partial [Actinobacteria bacterium]|nr:pilus assembly protein CpaF [Actinomycetota bacterium]